MAAATALVVLQSSRVRAKLTRAYRASTRTVGTARRPGMSQREIMEKALHMKQEAGPLTRIPEHQTANQGGVQGGQVGYTDTALVREGTFTENTGSSHGARVGDSGRTTGPGR